MNILDINCRTPVAEIVYIVLSLFNQETFVKKLKAGREFGNNNFNFFISKTSATLPPKISLPPHSLSLSLIHNVSTSLPTLTHTIPLCSSQNTHSRTISHSLRTKHSFTQMYRRYLSHQNFGNCNQLFIFKSDVVWKSFAKNKIYAQEMKCSRHIYSFSTLIYGNRVQN